MSKSKAIGTKAETAVVRAFRPLGFPDAERHVLKGSMDEGDIWLTARARDGVIVEVKGGEHARRASDNQIDLWLAETELERMHCDAAVGILVLQRRYVGEANAGNWWAFMTLDTLMQLMTGASYGHGTALVTLRMTVKEAAAILVHAGYGEEP